MSLIVLPPELLVAIASFLGSTRSISRFARTNRRTFQVIEHYIYRYDVKTSKHSPKALRNTSLFPRSRRDANSIIPKSLAAGAHVNGSLYILKAAETGNAALVRILLEAGAKVNSTCWMGISVLGYAMEANNIKTVHLLFSQLGIDLDYWCRHQEPVLLTAVARDKLDLAEVLLPLVDPNQIGQEGITPLRLAIAELLHDDWRTDVEFSSRIDQTPARMAFYHAEVSNMDFPIHFKKRKTARHILFYLACGGGNFGLAEEILELATHDDEEFLKRWKEAA
ncbi:hypothetical protein ARSEF1564_002512 [Beauveria bassiana]